MDELKRFGVVEKGLNPATEMLAVNHWSLKTLVADDVYLFRVAACDNQIDRDNEQFSDKALTQLAKLYPGKSFLFDHSWSARGQQARIYGADVEETGNSKRLVLRVYMLRSEDNEGVIAAIDGGILREVSVGCRVERALCSICGTDKALKYCDHRKGAQYDGKTCTVTLDNATDAYECSFVAVPAQPKAGVVKTYGGEENREEPQEPPTDPENPDDPEDPKDPEDPEKAKALALLELEYERYL